MSTVSNIVTLNQILSSDYFKEGYSKNIRLRVNGENVWDFKEQNGNLRLIHEPLGVKEEVTLSEIQSNYGEEVFNLPVVSETEECEIREVEILTYKDSSEVLNFKTR